MLLTADDDEARAFSALEMPTDCFAMVGRFALEDFDAVAGFNTVPDLDFDGFDLRADFLAAMCGEDGDGYLGPTSTAQVARGDGCAPASCFLALAVANYCFASNLSWNGLCNSTGAAAVLRRRRLSISTPSAKAIAK